MFTLLSVEVKPSNWQQTFNQEWALSIFHKNLRKKSLDHLQHFSTGLLHAGGSDMGTPTCAWYINHSNNAPWSYSWKKISHVCPKQPDLICTRASGFLFSRDFYSSVWDDGSLPELQVEP